MPTIAWFRPAPPPAARLLDDTAAIAAQLAPAYHVDFYDERRAHDFVWTHARQPYNLCVYELADSPMHAFVWPYLIHYPGVLRLRSPAAPRSRRLALAQTYRDADYAAEIEFGGWDLLRAPLLVSRMAVVSDDHLAARLRQDHPGALVRHVPLGFGLGAEPPSRPTDAAVRFVTAGATRPDVMERAVQRARAAGAQAELIHSHDAARIADADVVLALEWPPAVGEPPIAALAGMAAARAVVVFETGGTARWPALDPQTWTPRALAGGGTPLVASLDPRDEEHSLVLAIRRLATDRGLVDRLASAGHAWWRQHATLAVAEEAWRQALGEALSLQDPPRPPGWPPHLSADGTQLARRILTGLGVEVDLLCAEEAESAETNQRRVRREHGDS